MMRRAATALLLATATIFAGSATALEGKWTPEQVAKLDKATLDGLELPLDQLWNPKTGTGLLAATVNLSGCSGAFVSATGLVVTNHHCVFSIVAEHSTPANDLITNGFVATGPAAELPGKGQRLRVPKAFTDVTKVVLGAVPEGADDVQRFKAIDRKTKAMVKECESQPATRCDVATFWGGLKYVLVEQQDITDLRLVYAPPRAVGEYGGEIDNWMWPRHTGDFAFVRAYVDDKPFQPAAWLPLSPKGTQPGDFVMVLGYPGSTSRELLAEEMTFRADAWYPTIAAYAEEMIAILEGVQDPAGKIAVASQLKSLHNRGKNARGQIEGLARARTLDKKRASDDAVLSWAKKTAGMQDAIAARAALLDELTAQKQWFQHDLLLSQLNSSSKALVLAATVARMAREREKPDAERDAAYMERERPRLADVLEREQKSIFLPAEKLMLRAFVKRALALPPGQRLIAIDDAFGAAKDDKAIAKKIDALLAKTKLLTLAERVKMGQETPAQLLKRKDPMVDLGLALARDLEKMRDEEDRRSGFSSRVRPVWQETVLAASKVPVAPDANRTLRVSFARVRGYVPKDGVIYEPRTTLQGMLAKQTGKAPFVVPAKVMAAAAKGPGRWMDPGLKDVPVCFLADADTTGGNSGSPVVDGKGRLVGINFDRVWENVANDFGYEPSIARNVNVDVRYMLWMLDQVEGARPLLDELGVK